MNDSEIVVGLDDSPPAKAALRWAAEYARLTGARLRAVSVVDWPLGVHADGRSIDESPLSQSRSMSCGRGTDPSPTAGQPDFTRIG